MHYSRRALAAKEADSAALEDLPAADELRKIVIEKPPAPLTADADLATVPPEQLQLKEEGGDQNAEDKAQNAEAT